MSEMLIAVIAREIMGRPDAHLISVTFLDVEPDGFDGIKVKLADVPLVTRGKNVGQPNWRRATNYQTRLISRIDFDLACEEWSARTGTCIACAGDGRRFRWWRSDEGTVFWPCTACNATGSADGKTISATRNESMLEATS